MIASSLVATASVHAQQRYTAADVSCDGTAHGEGEGDGDEAPADGDQPFPHHHGACHGHSLTAPVVSAALPEVTAVRQAPTASGTARLARRIVGPALEPPRA